MKLRQTQLPKGWEMKKLGDIGVVFNGNSINEQVKKTKYTNIHKGLPYIATKDVSYNNVINYENGIRIPFEEKKLFKIAPKDTVLICAEGGSAGRKIGFTNQDICFGNKLFALNTNKDINSRYVYYYYFSSAFQQHFINELAGIIGGVSMNKFKEIKIPLPSFQEQQYIVDNLDEVFAAIEKAKENTETNLRNARELFESYLESVFANPGEDWEEKTLTEIGITQTGTTPKTSDKENFGDFIPFVKPADINISGNGEIRYNDGGLSEKGLNNGRKILKGSILMVCIGASIGKVGFIDRDVSCNQQINTVTVYKEYYSKFFYYALSTKSFFEQVILNSAQTTLPIINKSKWENLSVHFPKSKNEQEKIVNKLDALIIESKKLEVIYQKKLDDLEELKKSILNKAYKGELS